jgi:hypothetical protein
VHAGPAPSAALAAAARLSAAAALQAAVAAVAGLAEAGPTMLLCGETWGFRQVKLRPARVLLSLPLDSTAAS